MIGTKASTDRLSCGSRNALVTLKAAAHRCWSVTDSKDGFSSDTFRMHHAYGVFIINGESAAGESYDMIPMQTVSRVANGHCIVLELVYCHTRRTCLGRTTCMVVTYDGVFVLEGWSRVQHPICVFRSRESYITSSVCPKTRTWVLDDLALHRFSRCGVNLSGAVQSWFFRVTCFGHSFMLTDTITLHSQLIVGRCKMWGSPSVRVSILSKFRYEVVKTPIRSWAVMVL